MNMQLEARIGIAGIHASVIGIVVAVLTGLIFYVRGTINDAEMAVLHEAESINDVAFARSAYLPGKHPLARSFVGGIDAKRLQIGALRAPEPRTTTTDVPTSAAEIEELFRYLHFLADPLHTRAGADDDYDLGNGKYIPRDIANRGEELLIVFNLISRSEIFPEQQSPNALSYTTAMPRRIYHTNAHDTEEWLVKVEAYVLGMKKYRAMQSIFPGTQFIDAMKQRDHGLIEYWESNPVPLSHGQLDPVLLLENNQEQFIRVASVAERTRYALNKYKRVNSQYPLRIMYVLVIVFFFVFLAGVVIPLVGPTANKCVYLHLPLLAYCLLYVGLIIYVIRKW